ncbi:energy transducer TonB [Glaciecola sp. 2405UD65-10]|uniref:energy transducer TonB n=1 Tax=Glaciecola sp. 2405UD65-10 TaxID=3397244 RepID=UPI003B5B37EC
MNKKFKWVSVLLFLLCSNKTFGTDTEVISEAILKAVENRQTIAPIVKFDPKYPLKASKQGIEGFCKLSFDLANKEAFAKPMNIKVIECTPSGVFEDASISALRKWIFLKIERLNTAESTDGLVTTMSFELD